MFSPTNKRWASALLLALPLVLQIGCAARATVAATPTTSSVLRPAPANKSEDAATEENADQARKTAPKKSTAKPDSPQQRNSVTEPLRNQARSALDDDNLPQATRLLERALRIDARDPETYYVFARLRQQQERSAAAIELIDKALSLRPQAELKEKLLSLRQQLNEQP